MKKLFTAILILAGHLGFSQSMIEIDSLSEVMCKYLEESNDFQNDTLRIGSLYNEILYPYLANIEENKIDSVGQKIFYRLQRNCVEFRGILLRLAPTKEEVVIKNSKPISKISRKELKKFKKFEKFKYHEVAGEETIVTLKDGYWIDKFEDGTYSKLSFKWINDTEFKLTYLDSNNETRSNFSVKGDEFIYNVLNKEANYYLMSVNIPGQQVYEEFKLYYE